MLVYNTGLIPSRFYEVLLDSDKESFKSIVVTSSLLILGTALVSFEIVNIVQTQIYYCLHMIYQTRETVFHRDIQTQRRELKI